MIHHVANGVNGKRSLTTLACMALLTLFIGACKKDEEPGITLKLMNRWSLVQINDTAYAPNTAPDTSHYIGAGDDYFEFRKDGRFYSSIMKALDSARYTYSEANLKINVGNCQYKILYITNNAMELWDPHYTPGGFTGYVSHKVTLKR
ncbi:hypothetical protein A4H97_20085 [Niastella yeongjuensis]|uniref:Lipocalin-like domain-containing protein n=1 Tax=Niastella yeongjuensis TaxID=354355 RepID=A0A1V9FC98_9BACT|nr:hypothetical protein [Niastella yeongjuensis]OQP55892.1 hypothetical protein A4H97_20085 [Niastella yeongjuensis]SEP27545.1 hypothetical protein SAMN05660816_05058 [Niastella yeongjuensis]